MLDRFAPLRIYLDANILISATYSDLSRFAGFWQMKNIHPGTSAYAIGEVRRNLLPFQTARFDELLSRTELFADPEVCVLPPEIDLVEKDRPILAATIHAGVDFLVTGDKRHFGHLYHRAIAGVQIISPAEFLDANSYRLPDRWFA
ncbi:MAG: PIN domain-containing protein [Edaphobacter sp.]